MYAYDFWNLKPLQSADCEPKITEPEMANRKIVKKERGKNSNIECEQNDAFDNI